MTTVNEQGDQFRRAQIKQKCELREVQALLPRNYHAYYNFDGIIMVEGWDSDDGTRTLEWVTTLLAANLIVAQEVVV